VKPRNAFRSVAGALLLLIATLAFSARDVRAHLGNLSYSEIDIRGTQALMRLKFAAHLIPGIPVDQTGKVKRVDIVRNEAQILRWLAETVKMETSAAACKP
jgi:hypothetical protein